MVVNNKSGLIPLNKAVLVRLYSPEFDKFKSSGLVIPDQILERSMMIDQMAVVVAIGCGCWLGEPEMRAKIGDVVMIARMSGVHARGTLDEQIYRVVNDNDIFLRIALPVGKEVNEDGEIVDAGEK